MKALGGKRGSSGYKDKEKPVIKTGNMQRYHTTLSGEHG